MLLGVPNGIVVLPTPGRLRMKLYHFVPALLLAGAACGDGGPPPRHQLLVVLAGTGTGSVDAAAVGIDCGTVCSAQIEEGTAVTLSAETGTSSTFAGWSGGGCSGTGTCSVTMSAAQTVTATFTVIQHNLTVTTDGPGGGTVTSTPAGINCGATCVVAFNEGSQVTLTPTPDGSSTFVGWSGNSCNGSGACIVTMSTAKSVAVTFSNVASIVVLSGNNQAAPANTPVADAIDVSIRNGAGVGVANTQVTFSVMAGGGFINEQTRNTDANGNVSVPPWTLGKTAVPQVLRVLAGSISLDVTAVVRTNFNIVVRFYGPAMSTEHQALFNTAAERISAIITGDVPDVNALNSSTNPSACGVSGQGNFNEIIDDILIYAAVEPIDGAGQVLASANPCLVSTAGFPVVGRMRFDAADINGLAAGGNLQDVIMHEMLHVIGVGTFWQSQGLVTGVGSGDPRYVGAAATAECLAFGGTVACASSVPVENTGGAGTVNSHWRETTFNAELMTGFVDNGGNPFSKMTIGSLQDLGYEVNMAAFDDYTIFNDAMRAAAAIKMPRVKWEDAMPPIGVLENGRVKPLPKQ